MISQLSNLKKGKDNNNCILKLVFIWRINRNEKVNEEVGEEGGKRRGKNTEHFND